MREERTIGHLVDLHKKGIDLNTLLEKAETQARLNSLNITRTLELLAELAGQCHGLAHHKDCELTWECPATHKDCEPRLDLFTSFAWEIAQTILAFTSHNYTGLKEEIYNLDQTRNTLLTLSSILIRQLDAYYIRRDKIFHHQYEDCRIVTYENTCFDISRLSDLLGILRRVIDEVWNLSIQVDVLRDSTLNKQVYQDALWAYKVKIAEAERVK